MALTSCVSGFKTCPKAAFPIDLQKFSHLKVIAQQTSISQNFISLGRQICDLIGDMPAQNA
ncbi:MAG: hypothetical protein CMM07_17475 [Rhodopirellula sp.]|nr:hypothetical protein [Rhodopirellula sp.]